jgi:hypothetical protein
MSGAVEINIRSYTSHPLVLFYKRDSFKISLMISQMQSLHNVMGKLL